jgi:hypothetical protein
MTERTGTEISNKQEIDYVADFKNRVGMGAQIIDWQELSAVVNYIQSLEAHIAQLVLKDHRPTLADRQLEASQNPQSNYARQGDLSDAERLRLLQLRWSRYS